MVAVTSTRAFSLSRCIHLHCYTCISATALLRYCSEVYQRESCHWPAAEGSCAGERSPRRCAYGRASRHGRLRIVRRRRLHLGHRTRHGNDDAAAGSSTTAVHVPTATGRDDDGARRAAADGWWHGHGWPHGRWWTTGYGVSSSGSRTTRGWRAARSVRPLLVLRFTEQCLGGPA